MASSSRRLIAVFAFTASLAVAQTAAANSYCVAPNTTCGGTNVADLQTALTQAAAATNDDSIFLGAATYVAPAGGFNYAPAQTSPLAIRGAGVGNTTITAPAGNTSRTLRVQSGGANIYDLTVNLPMNVAPGYEGLDTNAFVQNVTVTENQSQQNARTGVRLFGSGSLRDSTVELAVAGPLSSGVDMQDGDTVLWNSTVTAREAVMSNGLGATALIGRCRLTGATGINVYQGKTDIAQTVVRFSSSNGIYVNTQAFGDTAVTLDGVVVEGPTNAEFGAIFVGNSLATAQSAELTIKNSAVRGAPIPMKVLAESPGHVNASVSYSDFDPAGVEVVGQPQAALDSSNNLNSGSTAGFQDEAAGDFHLRLGSPLIDAGDPASASVFTDLDGNPLNLDGDGDGIGRRDIGAFEVPAAPPSSPAADPSSPAAPSEPTTPTVPGSDPAPPAIAARDTKAPILSRLAHAKSRFRYTLSEAARVSITIQRAVVTNGHKRWRTTRTLVRPSRAGSNSIKVLIAKRSRYRALVRAVDAAGNRSALARVRFW